MKYIWDEEKNQTIKNTSGRMGISFEKIRQAIYDGKAVKDIKNNSIKYNSQNMFIVKVNGYPFKLPYEYKDKDTIKLITAFPYKKFKQ